MTRKPIAFRLETPKETPANPKAKPTKTRRKINASRAPKALPLKDIIIEPEDFEQSQQTSTAPAIPEPKNISRSMRWGAIFFSAFTGLIMMWASISFLKLIEDLFARSPILGWIGTALLVLAGLAALAIILREIIGIFSIRKISKIQENAEIARNTNDLKKAKQVVDALQSIYAGRNEVAWGLAAVKETQDDIIDGRDRINLAERDLLLPLDEIAGQIVASTSRRVTLITAVTPAAILDVLFVAAQNMKMLRQLATLYGGRPGTFGTIKLTGMVISHLAVTGGLALTDNLVQQFIGKGLLGRLSARFGEGAVNGILTTRIGLAALDLTRPIPFTDETRPSLPDFLKNIISLNLSTDENVKSS